MKNTLIYLLLLLPVFAFGQTNNQLYDGYRKAIEKGNYKKAEKELGDKFDIKSFHDLVLSKGSVKLSTLESMVNSWIVLMKKG